MTSLGSDGATPGIQGSRVAQGPLVFVSGQIALDADGRVMHPGDAEAQAEVVLARIADLLAAHGCTWSDVIKLTTYLVDIRDLDAVRVARSRALDGHVLPAATTVAVAALARSGLLVEIDAIAAMPTRDPAA